MGCESKGTFWSWYSKVKELKAGSNKEKVVGPFEKLARELHKLIRRKFARQVLVCEIDEIWGADLVEMQAVSEQNNGFRYMLNVIDVFSKFAWSVPLKNKKVIL